MIEFREYKVWCAGGEVYTKRAMSCRKACLSAFIDGRTVVRVGRVKTDADKRRNVVKIGDSPRGFGRLWECKFLLPERDEIFVVRLNAPSMESAIDSAGEYAYHMSGDVPFGGAGVLGVRMV